MPSASGRLAGRCIAWVGLVAASALASAQGSDGSVTPGMPSSHARFAYEQVRVPGGGPRLGLVGTSYLIDVAGSSGFSVGPAVYGAVSGNNGGFFTLGGELAWRRR